MTDCMHPGRPEACPRILRPKWGCLDNVLRVNGEMGLFNVQQLRAFDFSQVNAPSARLQQQISSGTTVFNLDTMAAAALRGGNRRYAGVHIGFAFNATLSLSQLVATLSYWGSNSKDFTAASMETDSVTIEPQTDNGSFIYLPYASGIFGTRNDMIVSPDAAATKSVGGVDTVIDPRAQPATAYTALVVNGVDDVSITVELLGFDHPLLAGLRACGCGGGAGGASGNKQPKPDADTVLSGGGLKRTARIL